jgi:hypothetical protein
MSDGLKNKGKENEISVMDITELIDNAKYTK